MNYRNHFSIAALALLLTSCSTHKDGVTVVSPEAYSSDNCWRDRQGNFIGLLALATDDQVVTPYPISLRCVANGNYSSYGEAALHVLNVIRLSDPHGVLQGALAVSAISDNTGTDRPMPDSDSKLYFIRAQIDSTSDQNRRVYEVRRVLAISDTGQSFGQLLDMSIEEREALLMRQQETDS